MTSSNTKLQDYQKLSLVDLIKRIVQHTDGWALREFHDNRYVFRHNWRQPLRFGKFVSALRENALKRNWIGQDNTDEVIEKAYDLTIDKFNNLPTEHDEPSMSGQIHQGALKHEGPDCRKYFGAYLKLVAKNMEPGLKTSQIKEEFVAASVLQNFVVWHFDLSFMESKRNASPFVSRYFWKIEGSTLCLWFSKDTKGRERREWLEANIKDADPSRPGERERIQTIINKQLAREKLVPIEHYKLETALNPEAHLILQESHFCTKGLAEEVAQEKATNIKQQRPAIQAMGETKLKKMILHIFEVLGHREYKDSEIARQFGMSKATFSRFAGSRWHERLGEANFAVPDLWGNTAKTIASHPNFVDAAKSAGFWKIIKTVLNKGKEPNTRKEAER